MDGRAGTSSVESLDPCVKSRIVIGFILPVLFLPSLLTHLVLWRMEEFVDLKVVRKPWFFFHPGKIDLKGTQIEWNDRLQAEAGRLEVRYPVHRALFGNIPLSVEAEKLAVSFGPRWSRVIGHEHVVFDHVSAKVVALSSGEIQLDYVNAESKMIQFHLKGAEA